MRFGTYAPQNLDRTWLGPITARTALQASRNLPAVALLDAVGPAQLMARLRRAGDAPVLPPGGAPGLAIALGGVGLSLEDLVRLYAAIANGGTRSRSRTPPTRLRAPGRRPSSTRPPPGTSPTSSPARRRPRTARRAGSPSRPAPATATATPGRSASTAPYVIGVWFGRPDGAPVPGALGLEAAAPALFDAFARLSPETVPLPPPPASALTLTTAQLPAPLQRFRPRGATETGRRPRDRLPARRRPGRPRPRPRRRPAARDPPRRRRASVPLARRRHAAAGRPFRPAGRVADRTALASSTSPSSTQQDARRGPACSCSEARARRLLQRSERTQNALTRPEYAAAA